MTYFSRNFYNFYTDMSAIFVWLKPFFTSIEGLVLSEGWRVLRSETSYTRSEREVLSSKIDFWTCKLPISVEILIIFPRIWSLILVQSFQCGHPLVTRLRFADVRIGSHWRLEQLVAELTQVRSPKLTLILT